MEREARPVTLTIGGSHGLAPDLLAAADDRWSLGPLTLPHELARVVVAEQLYPGCHHSARGALSQGRRCARMTEWFEEWFGEEYLQLYPAPRRRRGRAGGALILDRVGFRAGWRILDVACGAGRHAPPSRRRAPGVSGSISLPRCCRWRARSPSAPLVRADMRALPVRPGSMDLTVNLFTSFGYFDHDAEHAMALGEMVSTLRPAGWFVIDFLNARRFGGSSCRARPNA